MEEKIAINRKSLTERRSEGDLSPYKLMKGEISGDDVVKKRGWEKKRNIGSHSLSEPGFDPGTCGLWAHHASAAPL
ncbi:hypothetical protein L6452_14863 [Arctium lappa]|uniref:Uncharacterized protein n=1 Tax=Arctium lappa TaxID=4217 RepID=A0ACB9CM40_ARCLA|nr:hypothetical protein L6452_14863 [Arctium lappa]